MALQAGALAPQASLLILLLYGSSMLIMQVMKVPSCVIDWGKKAQVALLCALRGRWLAAAPCLALPQGPQACSLDAFSPPNVTPLQVTQAWVCHMTACFQTTKGSLSQCATSDAKQEEEQARRSRRLLFSAPLLECPITHNSLVRYSQG